MPSEDRVQGALDALAAPREAFRSAVAAAVAEVGARIDAQRVHPEGRVDRVTHELGAFAAGRIDAGLFAAVFASGSTMSPGMIGRLEQAHERLRWVAERGDEQFVVRVGLGGDLRGAVGRGLAEIGGAFAAARDAEVARTGRTAIGAPGETAGWFPFRRWSRPERRVAPPLVIDVHGGDAQALGLAEFLDGGQKLVLVVRGSSPVAPLARLATPGVFVMQTREVADLAELVAVEGPGIAALVPEGCAEFVHRPGAAGEAGRLEVRYLPAEAPEGAVGSFSAFQQAEDLAYLRAMIAAAAGSTAATHEADPASRAAVEGSALPLGGGPVSADAASAAPDPLSQSASAPPSTPAAAGSQAASPGAATVPADRLAAWLLRQADLNGAG